MRKLLFHSLAAALLSVGAGSAAIIDFNPVFGPEAPGATGTGGGLIRFDTTAQTLFIDVNWSGLSGTTTIAHIHCCTAIPLTGTAGVAVTPGTLPGFPVGVQAGSYSVTLDLTDPATYTATFLTNFGGGTTAGASAALLQAGHEGKAYFNIHTSTFGGGEIRGFLTPEPATMALTGIALAGLAGCRCYRRKRQGKGS